MTLPFGLPAALAALLAAAGDPSGRAASLEDIRDNLARAEDSLATGDPETAVVRLAEIVESPRFDPWKDSPEHQNAEFLLGRALTRSGVFAPAGRTLVRVLARGPKAPYFGPAFRGMLDLALESRDNEGVLAAIQALDMKGLPKDAESELAYLRGKVAYDRGADRDAEGWFAEVDRHSRFFASALYFRGLLRARRGEWRLARDAFCEIVEQRDKERLAFYIDGRYFALKDLSFLALGRISHEQGRYDDAYYFYFQVPQDSERLHDALFEASWSMFQKGENEASRAFLDQFEKIFPRSPLRPEVTVLRAHLDLRSCAFGDARDRLLAFVKEHEPVLAEVQRAIAEPRRAQALFRRLLAPVGVEGAADMDRRILDLLKLDGRFFRFFGQVAALDRESAHLARAALVWGEIGRRQQGGGGGDDGAARKLVQDVRGLAAAAAGDQVLRGHAEDLLARVEQAAPITVSGPLARELGENQALADRVAGLRARLVDAQVAMAHDSLVELGERLRALMRQARLGQIDAVIGKKKKLEREIANLYEGRFPPEMFGKLQIEGLMGDDEEYWPYEGEHWSDEYEDYR